LKYLGKLMRVLLLVSWLVAAMILVSSVCGIAADAGKNGLRLLNVNNSVELMKAADDLSAGGGTIHLAPGEYVIDKPVELTGKNCVSVEGSGWDTTIRKRGDGDAVRIISCGFCSIRNMLIIGDSAAAKGSGVVFKDSSSCTVNYCRIAGFAESGIRFEGDSKNPMSSNTVSNCHFIGNLQDQLYSYHNNDFYITGNQFGTHTKYPRTGCVLDHSSAGTYSMNYHWGNMNALRLGPGANFNRIENNRFEQSRETGIVIGSPKGDGCVYNIITGNTIHTNSEGEPGVYPAVSAANAVETTFCTNQIFSWNRDVVKQSAALVVGAGCRHWIIKDNIFRDCTGKALVYDEGAGHIVKDNLMD